MSQGNPESQGHPAWQEYLDSIPEDLQPVVSEAFKKFDQHNAGLLQGEREKFDPYKPLIENNVPMENVEQALWLAQQLQEDPAGMTAKIIEAYELGFIPKNEQQQQTQQVTDPKDDLDMTDLSGLENHPAFQQLKQQADQFAQWQKEQADLAAEQEASTELENFLEAKHNDPNVGEFDDLYVTALMAQGIEFDDAAKQYQQTIADAVAKANGGQQQQQVQPPIVAGGAGNSGSGIPNEVPNMGGLSKNSLNDAVLQMLARGDVNSSNT